VYRGKCFSGYVRVSELNHRGSILEELLSLLGFVTIGILFAGGCSGIKSCMDANASRRWGSRESFVRVVVVENDSSTHA